MLVTRSQTRRNYEDLVDLSDLFLAHSNPTELTLSVDSTLKVDNRAGVEVPIIRLGRAELVTAQKTDSTLSTCVEGGSI